MANPSGIYIEDENARQTLPNGTVLKWTKKNSEIYTVNQATDRSICYCNWAGELDYANRGFHQWQGGCVVGDDLGHNACEGNGFSNLHANSLKQIEAGQPRIEGIYTGVVLTNSDGDGAYVWGYNPEKSECVNQSNGGDRRYLLDMDINKMIFNITFTVYDKADFDAIDYTNSNNPESNQLPSTHNITLKQLYENPDDYYVASFNWGATYIYGEDTNDHWRSTQVYPAHIIDGETVGQFKGTKNFGIFGLHYATGNFSYDNSDPMNPNAHPNFTGGGSTPAIYNNMNNGYFMACGREINLNPVYSYNAAGTSAETIAQFKWGTASSWNHNAYVNQEFFDYGGSVIWCAYGAHAYYNSNTSESKYREYIFSTRKMLKGQYALDYVASFGLYFASEAFDPDTASLTPETLGDDNRIMLGEMSADGTTTGRWITDIESYHGPNKDGKTSNPDYDPSSGGGGGGGSQDDDPWNGVDFGGSSGGGGAFAKFYYMTSTELANLRSWMNSNSVPQGFDPMAQIIGLSQVPVAISGSAPENVMFVNSSAVYGDGQNRAVDTGVATQRGLGRTIIYNLGSVNIPRRMQQRGEPYLDYSCAVELYLPFCGVFSLDTQAVMGRTITAQLVLDPTSGSVTGYAWVTQDGQKLPVAYGSGQVGVDLPITAQQYSMSKAALNQANANIGQSIIQSAVGLAVALGTSGMGAAESAGDAAYRGGRGSYGAVRNAEKSALSGEVGTYVASQASSNVVGSFMNWGRSIRELSYGNNTAISGSFGGSYASWSNPFTAYVKIIRPKFQKPSNYNHTQAVPCVEAKTVGSCTGLIQCIGVDTSSITNATSTERDAIATALANGVYAGGGN